MIDTKIAKAVIANPTGQKIGCLVLAVLFVVLTLIFQNKKLSTNKLCITGAMIPLMYLFYDDWNESENVFDDFIEEAEEEVIEE